MPIIAAIPDEERQLMRKEAQQTHDKNHARRLIAMLMLHQGMTVTDVARLLCAARSSVGRWINWFTLHGVEGLKSLRPGRAPRWPVADILQLLPLLVQRSPKDFGWLRSRWSTELLALVINRLFDVTLHRSTLHRYLRQADMVWRRAAPTLKIKDPHYEEKRLVIDQALAQEQTAHPVFYQDEVDIDLNPKIGADWMPKGQQKRIATPGQNQKHYLAGALHSGTGRVHYVSGSSKSSYLFISLLETLRRTYRRAKTITLVADNYIIHKSRKVERWLEENPKFRLLFLPMYSPWLNPIERLWLSLHETITRNHQCRYMWQLLKQVAQFMNAASLFPGNQQGLAKVER
ncbi:TPA_asm: IS630 family transposase [Salmonella enterica subsp. enterica serovar Typhimurium]|uniref:IS630 family transposase n=1 Tax=Salmonella typhimurium TaxID=90371 RepID=A0A5Y0LXN8_SALTM|nr:IS630 family transposase [Salmonella enterica]EBX8951479.1 IS630 family transposase [Salmonella enterica subsp. enterica serovar Typhimurium]ECB6621088.1 IS630 family transposase [Salmonella enterica subsp. enterica serovar Typhimurium]ECH0891661.1 IS630 family transposase [Salmonella enterica subsp. enterica serovar Typhimurium]ECM1769664.1 IS630 family transposase [Salmonella enterica subsp. enterica serovar Typhimurium]ECN6775054.1 IS630 family transposase [Salmonella enterica subsp. ent